MLIVFKGTTIQLLCFLTTEFPVQFLTKRYGFKYVLPTMMMMWGTVCMLTFYMMLNDINILQPGPKLGCVTAPLSTSHALLSEHVKVVSFQVLFCLQHTSTSQESSLSVLQFSGQHLTYDFLYNL